MPIVTPFSDPVQAHTLGLIDENGLAAVCVSACQDLRFSRARYALERVSWQKAVKRLNEDLRSANQFLSDAMQVCAPAPASCL